MEQVNPLGIWIAVLISAIVWVLAAGVLSGCSVHFSANWVDDAEHKEVQKRSK